MDSGNLQLVSKKTPVCFSSKNNFETESIAKEDMKRGTTFSDNLSKCFYYGFQEPFKQERMTEAKISLKICSYQKGGAELWSCLQSSIILGNLHKGLCSLGKKKKKTTQLHPSCPKAQPFKLARANISLFLITAQLVVLLITTSTIQDYSSQKMVLLWVWQ